MRVLLATDGSSGSAVAADLVGNVGWPIGTSIEAVRVVSDGSYDLAVGPWPGIGFPIPPNVSAAAVQDAEDALLALLEPLRKRGLTTDHAVLRGRPADALLDWIGRHHPDLVIVGNRGLSALDRTLLGSVSAELVDGSPVPVLVARRPTVDRVVVAVDGSDIASEMLATVRRWPFLAASEIRTLSVAPSPAGWRPGERVAGTPDAGGEDNDRVAEILLEHDVIAAGAAASLRDVGFTANSMVLAGPPGPTIVAFASDWDVDLVIMGSHGRTGLARLLLGSVARSVLHHATCSVLVVRRHPDPKRSRRSEPVARPWTILAGR